MLCALGGYEITTPPDTSIRKTAGFHVLKLEEMSPEIEHLISLQHTDREIQRLKNEIAELPKRVAAIEQKLAGTKAVLEKAHASVKGDEAARRKYEHTYWLHGRTCG